MAIDCFRVRMGIMNKNLFYIFIFFSIMLFCGVLSAVDSSSGSGSKNSAGQQKQSTVQKKNVAPAQPAPPYTVNGKTLRQSVLEIKPLMTRQYPRNSLSGAKSLLLQQMSALEKILKDYKSQSGDPLYQKVETAYVGRVKIKQKYQRYF